MTFLRHRRELRVSSNPPVVLPSTDTRGPASPRSRLGFVIAACLGLSSLSLLLPSALTYDPWSWVIWGREILNLNLSTRLGPAWKPLPVAFDTVFAIFGGAAPWLWLIVARAGGLLALVIAYRLGNRLAGPGAGIVAAAGLALTVDFLSYLLALGMSEPLLAGLVLLAFERHLDDRRLQACFCLFGGSLLRPETWPLFGTYCLYLLVKDRSSRLPVAIMMAALPLAWFLPEYLASGDLMRSSKRAAIPSSGGAVLLDKPGLAVISSLNDYLLDPIKVGVAVATLSAIARAVLRKADKAVVSLLGIGLFWTAEVALLTQFKLAAGEQRFLIVAAAAGCVVGGVGLDRLVRGTAAAVSRIAPRPRPLGIFFGGGVAILLILLSLPSLTTDQITELASFDQVAFESTLHRDLQYVISDAGGRDSILRCDKMATGSLQVPLLAWELGIHLKDFAELEEAKVIFASPHKAGAPISPNIEHLEGLTELTRQGAWSVLVTNVESPRCQLLSTD